MDYQLYLKNTYCIGIIQDLSENVKEVIKNGRQ